jgi:hypothetical protein
MDERGRTQREHRLLARANAQFGLLRYEDLVAEGLTAGAIESRLEARRLNRVHHKVYAFGHTALREEGEWLAALWACHRSSLSHRSAARDHRWTQPRPPRGPGPS